MFEEYVPFRQTYHTKSSKCGSSNLRPSVENSAWWSLQNYRQVPGDKLYFANTPKLFWQGGPRFCTASKWETLEKILMLKSKDDIHLLFLFANILTLK